MSIGFMKNPKKGGEILIYDNIKKIAKERGISIRKIEIGAGIGNGVIAGWKESSPTVENLKRVADYLGVPLEKLIQE